MLPKQYSIHKHDTINYHNINKYQSDYKDSFITVAVGKHYQHGNFHNFFLGKHYRNLWSQPIQIKVFDIGSVKGKMTINKKGGGFQTLSLKLTDSTNKKYVIRTIDKDETHALPPFWRKTFMNNIFKDQTSALNPFASLAIPPLSEAAGLYHTNPDIYFIPYDERFGQYAKEFEGRVVIFEEFPDSSWANTKNFGFADNIINSEHLLKKRFTDQNVRIDNRLYAKARLFDIWIGDWDRHVDQWRWTEKIYGDLKIFKPIARDRDMAFFKYSDSGLLPFISSKINPKLQSFDFKYGDVKGLAKNAKYLDHLLLNGLDESELLKIADSLKNIMSDQVIENAISQWPSVIFDKEGKDVIAKLKTRRNNLDQIASEFYKLISKEALVVGTDETETFEAMRINNNETQIKMYDKENRLIFSKIFSNEITNVISIYMLGGDDKIKISGKVKNGIDLEIYGGKGDDFIKDESEVKGLRKRIKVYDTKSGNTIQLGKDAEDLTSKDSLHLDFDRVGVRRR